MNPKIQLEELMLLGVSQKKIAEATSCSQASISRISQGKQSPSFATAIAINDYYLRSKEDVRAA